MSRTPAVTVFMPLFNQGDYVGDAVRSILTQTYEDFELLIVDDGSTDKGPDVVRAIADRRIRLVANGANLGIPATRNRGLALARGRYLANLDSDDLAHPRRLERQLAFLEAHPGYALVGSWCGYVDSAGRRSRAVKRHATTAAAIRAEMLFRCPISNRSMLARTDVLRRYGYDADFAVRQDVELFQRIGRDLPVANLPQVLVWGRRHDGQITGRTTALRKPLHCRILAASLAVLGIVPTPEELDRHFHVGRAWPGFAYDRQFLRWTAAWLEHIATANQRQAIHPPATLKRVLGEAWARTCWQAGSDLGGRAAIEFVRGGWAGAALGAMDARLHAASH